MTFDTRIFNGYKVSEETKLINKIEKEMDEKIIHKLIIKEGKPFYLCNQAVTPSKDKCTILTERVTCKNCLKQLSEKQNGQK